MLSPEEIGKAFDLLQLKTQEQRDTMLSQGQQPKPATRIVVHLQASNMTAIIPEASKD